MFCTDVIEPPRIGFRKPIPQRRVLQLIFGNISVFEDDIDIVSSELFAVVRDRGFARVHADCSGSLAWTRMSHRLRYDTQCWRVRERQRGGREFRRLNTLSSNASQLLGDVREGWIHYSRMTEKFSTSRPDPVETQKPFATSDRIRSRPIRQYIFELRRSCSGARNGREPVSEAYESATRRDACRERYLFALETVRITRGHSTIRDASGQEAEHLAAIRALRSLARRSPDDAEGRGVHRR